MHKKHILVIGGTGAMGRQISAYLRTLVLADNSRAQSENQVTILARSMTSKTAQGLLKAGCISIDYHICDSKLHKHKGFSVDFDDNLQMTSDYRLIDKKVDIIVVVTKTIDSDSKFYETVICSLTQKNPDAILLILQNGIDPFIMNSCQNLEHRKPLHSIDPTGAIFKILSNTNNVLTGTFFNMANCFPAHDILSLEPDYTRLNIMRRDTEYALMIEGDTTQSKIIDEVVDLFKKSGLGANGIKDGNKYFKVWKCMLNIIGAFLPAFGAEDYGDFLTNPKFADCRMLANIVIKQVHDIAISAFGIHAILYKDFAPLPNSAGFTHNTKHALTIAGRMHTTPSYRPSMLMSLLQGKPTERLSIANIWLDIANILKQQHEVDAIELLALALKSVEQENMKLRGTNFITTLHQKHINAVKIFIYNYTKSIINELPDKKYTPIKRCFSILRNYVNNT